MSCDASPVVLVLASGRGERFRASGGTVHKLQALLGGRAVMQHTLDAVRASGLRWHVEDAGHPGMGDSIAAAVRATRDAPGWLVLPADLPLVLPGTLRRIADALTSAATDAAATAAQPVFQGRPGHPVGFSAGCLPSLLALRGPQGAAAVLRAQREAGRCIELPVDDEGIAIDIDTLDDLARAEAIWCARQREAPAG
ncbi:MAG: nucleotidyltransferase family protein [Comamonadaceae bacterium]|nr:MAG: nucleotidyltransferase family protein [Comamonadaceae bacterium]